MAYLSMRVLGGVDVARDEGKRTSFESDKVRALLAYLAVEAGRAHRREALAGLLWPEYPEETAHHNLSQALFNLRKALDDHSAKPPYLLISREAIQFNRESHYSLDLEQFNADFAAWGKSRGQGEGDADLALLEEMAALYQGEFLQGFSLKDSAEFEEWILVQRAAAHQRVMQALAALVEAYEKRGDLPAARRGCLRQLELDAWREEAHCGLMRLLALEGQRSAALAQYETCRKMLAEAFGAEPAPQTRELYEQIRKGALQPKTAAVAAATAAAVTAAPLPKLPVALTPFLGREKELAELGRMLADPECRCISLVGPGGMGKTRLALEAAARNRNGFAHAAAFIPLAAIQSCEAAVAAIAGGIGFAFHGPADPRVQLLNHLEKRHMLLVLDNVEQLLAQGPGGGSITDLVVAILQQAPQVKLLVTSREALNLAEEWCYALGGLDYPAAEAVTPGECSAVALFVQHARRVRPGFEPDTADLAGMARLCRRVEGMPLAIELAATWVRVLAVDEIDAEIERSLDFLNAQRRDLPERHRSMRAVFDQSWQMLSLDERQILSRLSVFHGGFGRQAAEQVAGASLLALSALVIRSLVRRTETGRYDLHELIRQFAASRLAEDPLELSRIQEQHSVYYLGLLAENDQRLHSAQQRAALKELGEEIDNLRAAWDWAAAQQKTAALYRASRALSQFFELRNWFKEGELLYGRTVEALRAGRAAEAEAVNPQVVEDALLALHGFFMFRQGRGAAAYAILAQCVERLRSGVLQSGAPAFPLIYSLGYLGIVCWQLGRFPEAVERLTEGIRFAQEAGERWYEGHMHEFLGVLAHDQGDYAQARQCLEQALAVFRQFGDQTFSAHTLSYLGRTRQALGDYSGAEAALRQSLALAGEMGYRFGSGLALDALGELAYAQGNYTEAQRLFGESAALFKEMGDRHRLSRTLNHQGMTSLALDQPGEAQAAFNAALALAQAGGLAPIALSAAAGLAALHAGDCGQPALALVRYILQQPVVHPETRALAGRVQDELEARLSPQAVEAAKQGDGGTSLDELVRPLISRL